MIRVVNEIHSSATKKNKEWQEKLPIVVLKAEEIMYSKANSEVLLFLLSDTVVSCPLLIAYKMWKNGRNYIWLCSFCFWLKKEKRKRKSSNSMNPNLCTTISLVPTRKMIISYIFWATEQGLTSFCLHRLNTWI